MIIENFCRPVSWHMNRILALRKILRKANLIFTLVKKKMGPDSRMNLAFATRLVTDQGRRTPDLWEVS